MRLRRAIAAASLIVLSLPTLSVSAATSHTTGVASPHTASPARNLDVERAQLRTLMAQRQTLLQRIATPNSQRGRLLALTMLHTAAAMLAADARALTREVDAALAAAQRAEAQARAARATILWLTPAAPGTLWSPAARAAAPGELAWAITAAVAATSTPTTTVAPALALAALSPWTSVPGRPWADGASAAPRTAATATPSTDQSIDTALDTASTPVYTASIGDPAYMAPAHGALTVDSGSGAGSIAAANPTVAAALLIPVTPSVTVAAPLPAPPALTAPDLPTLMRRLNVVSAALDHVHVLEDWLQGHDLSSAIKPDGSIPSPDVLHQQLDRWSAQAALSDTGAATATATAPAGRVEPARGRWDVVAANTLPQLFAPVTTAVAPHAQPRVAMSAGREQGARESVAPAVALGAALALTGSMGVTLDATLAGDSDRATLQSSVADAIARRVAPNTIVAPLALAPLVTATVTATATATTTLSETAVQTATAAATMTGTVAAGTGTALASASPASSVTSTLTPTLSPSPIATVQPAASQSPSATPTSTATPSVTNSPTATPSATDSPTETPSATDSPTPSVTPSATDTPTTTPSATPSVTPTATDSPTATLTPTATDTATMSATPAATATLTATAALTSTAAVSGTLTPGATTTVTATVPTTASVAGTVTAPLTDTSAISATATTTATTALSATAPLTAAAPVSATAPVTPLARLDLAIDSAPALTVTADVSGTAPITLVVTLPLTAANALAPGDFPSQRGALESVLRQGQALFAHLQAAQAGAEAAYHATLSAVIARNSLIENTWLRRLNTYQHYHATYPAYLRRVAAYNAYAHRLHLAGLRHTLWQQRLAAWTRYAQQLAAYRAALAARGPVSGTVPLSGTAGLPPKPLMPPYPGPEPAPFSESPPPWPGTPPVFAANPGPEPRGLDLPAPPAAVPPWDGASQLISLLQFGSPAGGVGALGTEETTQAALLAAGAFDVIGAYQDPVKGPISTYWGGQTIFQSFHTGIDIAAPMYTPVRAAAAGKVIWAGYAVPGQRHDSYGLCVIIQHNAHFSTLYAHMDDLTYGLQVRVGDIVQQGQIIGHVGLTGWTTGPHLHFEMRQDNVQFNPLLLLPNPAD